MKKENKKRQKKAGDLFRASEDAMLAETATAPNTTAQICYSPNQAPLRSFTCLNTKPGKHQTVLSSVLVGFVFQVTKVRAKHQCASADLDCQARQLGEIHSGLPKLCQNLCI